MIFWCGRISHVDDMVFELIIKKRDDNTFIAKCPIFPSCKGIGDDEEKAIKKLCKSISYHVSKKVDSFLTSRFITNDYSEIITHPNNNKSFQHRVIDVFPKSQSKKLNVFLNNAIMMDDKKENIDKNNVVETDNDLKKIFTQLNKNHQFLDDDDGKKDFFFGISLCLN